MTDATTLLALADEAAFDAADEIASAIRARGSEAASSIEGE